MCLVTGVEGSFDLPVGDVVLAVDAVRVDGEQHGNAVPGPLRDLGGGGTGDFLVVAPRHLRKGERLTLLPAD
jgi:hypothetical protein